MTTILVTAESFGYGPVITCLQIMDKLEKIFHCHMVFMGSGISFEQAKLSGFFSEYCQVDTYQMEELHKNKKIFDCADMLISFENFQSAIFAIQLNKSVFFIDNLFWMWDEIPKELYHATAYFITESLNMDQNIEQIGKHIQNKIITGPLREIKAPGDQAMRSNKLLVNIGGGDSYMLDHDKTVRFYSLLQDMIIKEAGDRGIKEIIFCGGARLLSRLASHCDASVCPKAPSIAFQTMAHADYLEQLHQCDYVLLSPGLGNFYEALSIKNEVFLLPPINYSQYLQSAHYRSLNLGFVVNSWDDFYPACNIRRYMKEAEGVNAVVSQVDRFCMDQAAQERFQQNIRAYFNRSNTYLEERTAFIQTLNLDGVDRIVDEIVNFWSQTGRNDLYSVENV